MVDQGHAVRISTRSEAGREAIEDAGAECWIGTPDRLATLRAALDAVTILCWLLSTAAGSADELRALHTERLRYFLTQAIDTTVRGFVYEPPAAAGDLASGEPQGGGERIVRELTERNVIPVAFLSADPSDVGAWLPEASAAVHSLLGCA